MANATPWHLIGHPRPDRWSGDCMQHQAVEWPGVEGVVLKW